MEQLNPLDMTGILNTNVTLLRDGLLKIKGVLAPLENYRETVSKETMIEGLRKSLRIIQETLVRSGEEEEREEVNK